MIVSPLRAEADLVGGRVWLSWAADLDADAGERPADIPRLWLRRKELDFEFTPLDPSPGAAPDPRLVFDSDPAFPETVGTVTTFDVPTVFVPEGTAAEVGSVSGGDPPVELIRYVRRLVRDPLGRVVRVEQQVLDVGRSAEGLPAGRTCYYELAADPAVPGPDGRPRRSRAMATPTDRHSTARWLYDELPSSITRHDVVTGPPADAPALPESRRQSGQLRRFIDPIGCAVDHLRSRADQLTGLRDIDSVDARLLPHLAATVGWDLAVDRPIPEQRHEIRHAARLYRITGTVPGCGLWVKRLVDWDAEIAEFWPNVFLTNDTGNPDDPDDHGSRTVDTADAQLVASLGGPDDGADYTYDTSPGGRYAFDGVGIFVTPESTSSAREVLRRRARLLANASVFLPTNMRPVVVLQGQPEALTDRRPVAVTDSGEIT